MDGLGALILVVIAMAAVIAACVWIIQPFHLASPEARRRLRERQEAERRADALLAEVLSEEEASQLGKRGYVEVPSPSHPNRVYRVPKRRGKMIKVYESGKLVMKLCVGPVQMIPEADVVLVHKLMIEGNEQEYLQKANRF